MRSSRVRIVLCGLIMIVAATGIGVRPSRADEDPQTQRDQVRREKAAAAQEVDALQASAAQVSQALVDLQNNVTAEQAELDAAQQAEARAADAAAQAQQRESDVQGRIADIKGELQVVAVRAYVSGATGFDASVGATATDGDGFLRQGYLKSEAQRDTDLVDNLRHAENDLAAARKDAETNASITAQKRVEAEQRVATVTAARSEQQAFADQVEQRIDQKLYEIQDLNALDGQLSDQIASQEAALAAQLPANAGDVGGDSGPPLPPPTVPTIPLTTVQGITVASSIAQSLDQMLSAAAADGVDLGGSGYRDIAAQWKLRQQNCPSPADSPPFECSPPTARAGSSMHERGLAIDFTYRQQFIGTEDNPGFQWLAANAGRFGFKNLPGEPWHWSTTGD